MKKKQTWFFENERAEKPKKKKTKSKSSILKEAVSGESSSQKLAQIASRSLTLFFGSVSTFQAIRSPNPNPPQAFRAAFPHKTGNGPKVKRPKKSKLVTASFLLTPQVATISPFQRT